MTETAISMSKTQTPAFCDMEPALQESILTKTVIFQGEKTTLKDLLTPSRFVDLDEVIDSELLSKLNNNEEISIGKTPIHNTPSHYKPRKFMYDDKDISEEKLCEYDEKSSFHITETICGQPGRGKSTVLDHLAVMVKKHYPHLWVIKMDFNDYSDALSEFKKNNTKRVTVIELLNSRPESRIKDGMERKIFSIRKKVALLVDGLDEACPDYKDIVKSIMLDYRDNRCFANVFIASSKNLSQALQLECWLEFPLIAFSLDERIDLFEKLSEHKLDTPERIESKIFAKELVKHNWIEDEKMLIGDLLTLEMFAEIYDNNMKWKDYYEFLTDDNSCSYLKTISWSKLFLLFVHRKYLGNETTLDENKLRNDIAKFNRECCYYLYIIALENILPKERCKLFNVYSNVTHKIPEEIEEKLLEMGIVKKDNGLLRFFHRTVAEFLVAECIPYELCNSLNKKFLLFFIKEILTRRQFTVIRSFFDSIVSTNVNSVPEEILKELGSIVFDDNIILFDLIKDGYINIFNLIVKCLEVANIDVDYDGIRSDSKTLLQAAISSDRSDLLELLVEKGVSVNSTDNTERTTLYDAVSKDNLNAVKFLVQRGAEVHCRDLNGRTPLHEAGFSSSVNVVEYLLAHGAVIDSKDRQGRTCLHESAKSGDLDKVKFLVDNGADVDSMSKEGTPIFYAVRNEHIDVVKYLIAEGGNLTLKDKTGASLLHSPEIPRYETKRISKTQSQLSEALEIHKILIKTGRNVNGVDYKGNTVLNSHIDADDKKDLVEFLVESGADAKLVDQKGLLPLDKAIQHGAFKTVKYFMENGATQYRRDSFLTAVRNGYLAIVKYLVERGVDVNVEDNKHYSPLQIAVQENHIDIIKFLVENGADVNAKTVKSCVETVLGQAINKCGDDIVKFLVDRGANAAGTLDVAANTGNIALVQILKAKGATIEEVYDVGDNVELLKYFFEKGIKVNMPYMLQRYAATGNLDIIRYLVDKGVDVNYEDYCRTALHEAAKYDHVHVVKFLVNRGARTDVRDLKKETALEKAIRHGNLDIAEFLLEHSDVTQVLNDIHRDVLSGNCRCAFEKLFFILKHGAQLKLDQEPHIRLFLSWLGCGYFGIPELLVAKSGGDYRSVVDIVHRFVESEENETLDGIFSRWDTVRYLLEKGLQIDVTQMEKYDFLTKAAWADDLKFVKRLVEKGVDVNRKDKDGDTALHKTYSFDVVRYLVRRGADVNSKSNNRSVLSHAIENKNFDTCKYLIEHGASVNDEHDRHTLLYRAATKGSFSKLKYLVDRGATMSEKECDNILHNVMGFGDLDLVKFLVASGAQIEGKDSNGRTVIFKAVEVNNLDIVKYLVTSGANVKMEDNKSVTLYEYASSKASLDIVKYLAVNGARSKKISKSRKQYIVN